MGSALDRLVGLRDADGRFDVSTDELLPLQMEAANERLQSRIDQIPLLKNRAEADGVSKVAEPADLVPLLFAHNTYKSYSERWLAEGQWDRMGKWLATVSTYDDAVGASSEGVDGIDEWVERLEGSGRFVACSSGTTGKPALLGATRADLEFASKANVSSFSWATGIVPARDRKFFGLGPRTNVTRNEWTRAALIDAFAPPDDAGYQLPMPVITTGSMMAMIRLRRRITEGSALPGEVAEFERLAGERLAGVEEAMADAVDTLIKSREETLFLTGMFQSLYPLATAVREQGYGRDDFDAGNSLLTGGGLKGAELPPDYREVICETFNVSEDHVYHFYSMQEINTPFPRCRSGRYHVAPWVIALPLDTPGEQLLDASDGEIEARAAFFDLSLDGRWGGVISGDRVDIDSRRCACGHHGPTIGPEITRYADLEGGDKISCAGTIDAYVRGGQ